MSKLQASQGEAGFSLMEVMVALAILATAAVGFMGVTQGSVEGTRDVEEKFLARIVADNQLADVFWQDVPLEQGISEGVERQMGREFTWVRTVAPGPRDGVLFIGVQVRRDDGPGPVLAEAGTLKGVTR